MKAILSVVIWTIKEFIAAIWLVMMAVTVTLALYIFVEIIYTLNNLFKQEGTHPQPANAVGLHMDELKDGFT